MVPAPVFVAGPYVADLLAQPDALLAATASMADPGSALPTLAGLLQRRKFQRVVLTGMGSSWHALYPLHLALTGAGHDSYWVETSELLLGFEPLRRSDTLLVVVSQSGESAEIVALLQCSDVFGHVVGVTNNPHSTVARAAGTVLPMCAGHEATVSCKTYMATLAVLHGLAAVLVGSDLRRALADLQAVEPAMRRYLADLEAHVAALAGLVSGVRAVFVTGRGVSLATAGTGGLILKEATRQPAEGMSCAAFRHGPFEMISDQVLVLVCAGDARVAALHRQLRADIVRAGGRAAFLSVSDPSAPAFQLPDVAPALLPLVEILPVQMLSLAIAARDGQEAGRFERATKITTAA
jgi:glucosamine--fructose-6-phosphate aminotransferase (isomerizing)